MSFIRRFTGHDTLSHEPLFVDHLRPDCISPYRLRAKICGDVFPAVRNERVDFYHKGGKLFSYTARGGFHTHHKYASVLAVGPKASYVTEQHLNSIKTFSEGYGRIKENCSIYGNLEAAGVAAFCAQYSCAKEKRAHRIVVLDIEVSLRRDSESDDVIPGARTGSDRIDMLLMDTKTGLIRFFEAKLYTNSEIWAKEPSTPRIVGQLSRYRRQLANPKIRIELLDAYKSHVDALNCIFAPEVSLPHPKEIDPEPRLVVFGFDGQQQSKIKTAMQSLRKTHGITAYTIGDIARVNPQVLFGEV